MSSIPLWWYLTVAAGLFCIGLYVSLARRNAVNVLMGVELMLNAVNLNAIAFWRYVSPTRVLPASGGEAAYITSVDGQVFAVFIIMLAAAEAAVGLALIISSYRTRQTVELDQFDLMRG